MIRLRLLEMTLAGRDDPCGNIRVTPLLMGDPNKFSYDVFFFGEKRRHGRRGLKRTLLSRRDREVVSNRLE
jgi:hypothetical protein